MIYQSWFKAETHLINRDLFSPAANNASRWALIDSRGHTGHTFAKVEAVA